MLEWLCRLLSNTVLETVRVMLAHEHDDADGVESCTRVLYQMAVRRPQEKEYDDGQESNVVRRLYQVMEEILPRAFRIFVREEWVKQVVCDATTTQTAASTCAIEFLCHLLCENRRQFGSITKFKCALFPTVRSVLAASKASSNAATLFDRLVRDGTAMLPREQHLFELIEHMQRLYSVHRRLSREELRVQVDSIEQGLLWIVSNVSTVYLPQLKLQWLQDLYAYHKSQCHFAEAAKCKEAQARVILRAAPEVPVSHAILALTKAVSNFEKAGQLEHAIRVSHRLALLYKDEVHDYQALTRTYEHLAELATRLSLEQSSSIPTASYFRVAWAQQVYVYKRPAFTSLGDFIHSIKQSYPHAEVVPENMKNSTTGSPLEQQQQQRVVVVHVNALEQLETDGGNSHTSFRYSLPFTQSGNAYGKTEEQFKREITLTVERGSFPACATRLSVRDVAIRIKCPIENSMDDIRRRNALLRRQVDDDRDSDVKTLTHVLKGSVDTHVHGGVPEIITVFLLDNAATEEDEQHRRQLKRHLVEFMQLCALALRKLDRLMSRAADATTLIVGTAEHGSQSSTSGRRTKTPFQMELEKSFEQMITMVNRVVDTPLQLVFTSQ